MREPTRGFIRLRAERDCRLVVEYVGLAAADAPAGTVRDRFTLTKGLQVIPACGCWLKCWACLTAPCVAAA